MIKGIEQIEWFLNVHFEDRYRSEFSSLKIFLFFPNSNIPECWIQRDGVQTDLEFLKFSFELFLNRSSDYKIRRHSIDIVR